MAMLAANNGQQPQPQKPQQPTKKEKVCTAAGAILAHAGIALSPVTGGPTAVLSVTTGEEIVVLH